MNILGVEIEERARDEIIQPDDFNRKRDILVAMVNQIDRIFEEAGGMSDEIQEWVEKIKSDINALPEVRYGDYVLADHHNDVIRVMKEIADLLVSLPTTALKATLLINPPKVPLVAPVPTTKATLEVTVE